MRRVREVLRLRHALGMSDRTIAQSLAIGKTTVGEYVCRAKVIGITWPVPEEIDDAELERWLFTPPRSRRNRSVRHWIGRACTRSSSAVA